MISLNYKNNVIRRILKEEFDEKKINSNIASIDKLLNKTYENLWRKHFYVDNVNDKNVITIIAPTNYLEEYPCEDEATKSKIISEINSTNHDVIDLNKDKKIYNVISIIKCNKIIIYTDSDSLDYDFNMKCICMAKTDGTSASEFEKCMKDYFKNRLTLDKLNVYITSVIAPIIASKKQLNNKNKLTQALKFGKINLDDKIKEIETIEATSIDKSDESVPKASKKSEYYSDSGKIALDPQHLIRSEKYMNVINIMTTVQNSLQDIQHQQKHNLINFIASHTISEVIDVTAHGNASKKVELIDSKVKETFPNKNEDSLKKKYNKSKKNITDIDTLGGLLNNSVGYTMIKKISTKPVEILSPIALANMDSSIKWGHDGDMTSNQIIDKLFGRNNMKNALISYPAAGEQFFDSYMAIPCTGGYKMMKVSTKGGVDGIGACASINSLYKMLINYDGEGRYPHSEIFINLAKENRIHKSNVAELLKSTGLKFTPYTKALVRLYPEETIFLLIFGGTTPMKHETIFNYIKNNKSFSVDYSHCKSISDYIKASNSLDITNCIIKLLNYQKYDISQINCVPRIEGNEFWYDYEIQYPAHFTGNVALEKRKNGVAFHILASK